ncbi:MAG: Transcription accessory protein (S1 RNA-binding domain) [Firmicutes bacterium]|nr:Transcription accessory protein (S1 RNA-binding domain) [Bacillota bacterium]MDI6706121.1 Tex family protein [Bacillota bacterium]
MEVVINRLCEEFNLKRFQVENTIKLIDEGNTIPFIARYRKEATGSLGDDVLRELADRLTYLRNLENRKDEVIRLIAEQEKLTPEIEEKVRKAETLQEVEDIYRPFRPKRRTRATMAREKGLEPLADIIMGQQLTEGNLEEIALAYVDAEKEVNTPQEALAGAQDIIAETISDDADLRKIIREKTMSRGVVVVKGTRDEVSDYQMYYDFSEPVKSIVPHRVLAINRGEKEEYLSVKVEAPAEEILDIINSRMITNRSSISLPFIKAAADDAYRRLIAPSIEREVRNNLTEKAEEQAIKVFGINLKNLLMQAPVKGKTVMGFDPAFRTGCKIAVVDSTGKLLDTTTVYPTPPQSEIGKSKQVLKRLIEKHEVDLIAIGNGTASRESEAFVAELLGEIERDVRYVIVNEAGASVYSASKLGSEEYPDINVSLRGAISIGRRLQDPLAELVKIDPKHVGVGQYQHDVNQKRLSDTLCAVVEDCVNSVGVDLNTASVSLLQYISGISSAVAKNIVAMREEVGRFSSRDQLLKVKRLGEQTYVQCAGFLRVDNPANILDSTAVHPESYPAARELISRLGFNLDTMTGEDIKRLRDELDGVDLVRMASELGIGIPTLRDIINELRKPGRDPREDMPGPLFHKEVMTLEDLKPGMVLTGTVRNVIDFGAFVDIGVHQDGLVHISQMSEKYVKNPMDVVAVGDIVTVKVLDVDLKRNRISLSMKGCSS